MSYSSDLSISELQFNLSLDKLSSMLSAAEKLGVCVYVQQDEEGSLF